MVIDTLNIIFKPETVVVLIAKINVTIQTHTPINESLLNLKDYRQTGKYLSTIQLLGYYAALGILLC